MLFMYEKTFSCLQLSYAFRDIVLSILRPAITITLLLKIFLTYLTEVHQLYTLVFATYNKCSHFIKMQLSVLGFHIVYYVF